MNWPLVARLRGSWKRQVLYTMFEHINTDYSFGLERESIVALQRERVARVRVRQKTETSGADCSEVTAWLMRIIQFEFEGAERSAKYNI